MGERLANKIYEIITSGHLRRLDQVDQEKEKVITMFKGIHGVGATTAQQFYAKVWINIMARTLVGKQILAVRYVALSTSNDRGQICDKQKWERGQD